MHDFRFPNTLIDHPGFQCLLGLCNDASPALSARTRHALTWMEVGYAGDDDDFGDLVVPEDPGNVHASVGGMVQLDDEADLELGPTENGHAERLKQGSKLSKKEKKALEGGLESGDAAQDAADAQQAPAKQKKIKKIKVCCIARSRSSKTYHACIASDQNCITCIW